MDVGAELAVLPAAIGPDRIRIWMGEVILLLGQVICQRCPVDRQRRVLARPVGGFTASVVPYSEGAPLPYIKRVSSFMTSESVRSIAPDTDLQNILDELTAIANRTAYLLTLK